MDPAAFLAELRASSSYQDQIVHLEHLPPSEARYGELGEAIHPELYASLAAFGLLPLYSHQAEAVSLSIQGRNIIVVTPAASGKTLCYNIPVVNRILTNKEARALYIFPTKALAQDQLRGLKELTSSIKGVRFATFDGDTPQGERGEIKRKAHIVLTNPDMLHLGILPNHQSWSRLFRCLSYVVIDEAHIYRGIFGSHVASVLRRLRRICTHYGSNPQFICCSATIANPKEHAERLVGLPFEVIDRDGSPHGGKDFIFWNPPLIDKARSTRRSANTEASFLFTELVRRGIRTLAFAKTRKLTELIYIYSRDEFAEEGLDLAARIKPYRAGYLPEERRRIERDLFEGRLLGVVATTALELGIDIGDLDATILTGYPGSISSTWQQAGRSGRREGQSLSFLIGLENPLDQYFMRHPEVFFQKSYENALIDTGNPHILKPHLLCAAWELPLSEEDGGLFGTNFNRAREELEGQGMLRSRQKRWYLAPSIAYPAEAINIRSTSSEYYVILDASQGNRQIETVEESLAFLQAHPGAIYLHQGETYLITELDVASRIAYAIPIDAAYYTQAREITDIRILGTTSEKDMGRVKVRLGGVEVKSQVTSFQKRVQFTEEVVGWEPLDLPPRIFHTVALWFDIPPEAAQVIAGEGFDFAGGLHAIEHAAIAMLPLFALCDRNDIGGFSTPLHPDTGRPQIFIYDGYPGGIGISEKGFELVNELWEKTWGAIAECPCEEGCPSCIQSPKCGNNNEPLDKRAALIILRELLGNNIGNFSDLARKYRERGL